MCPEGQMSGAATILAIDPDSSRLDATKLFLTAKGFVVATAAGAGSGLALLKGVDLIIASLALPRNEAIDLCRKVRADHLTSGIPVLLVSPAPVTDNIIATLFEAGADDYMEVQQPGELLARRVARWLHLNAAQHGRLLSEETLRESEEQYRLFFEANPEPMWVYDRDTLAILAVNEAAITHYGYSRGEFLEMHITDLRPAEDI